MFRILILGLKILGSVWFVQENILRKTIFEKMFYKKKREKREINTCKIYFFFKKKIFYRKMILFSIK